MALSNWDLFALDENSQPTNGILVAPGGVRIKIYKNWLYLYDDLGARNPDNKVVAFVQEGVFTYKGVHVEAIRGPKNGIYCAAWANGFPPAIQDGTECKHCGRWAGGHHQPGCPEYVVVKRIVMVGMGVGGYDAHGVWVGIEPSEVAYLRAWLNTEIESSYSARQYVDGEPGPRLQRHFTYHRFDDEIRSIDLSKGLRANQGDMFLAAHVEGLGEQVTPPGEAPTPHLSKILDEVK